MIEKPAFKDEVSYFNAKTLSLSLMCSDNCE